jgi:cyclophilin family peptidyl-prolyl cis-trans isomerase
MIHKLCKFLVLVLIMAANTANALDRENALQIELKDGIVIAELYPDKAPNHVKRIKELAREGFYDGVVFHRVIQGFMVQTGDPTGTGMGGSDKPDLKAEFNDMHHERGVLSMARAQNPNSANSQFFIMLERSPHLDGQYSAFGKVVEGMEYVDSIKMGDPYNNGMVENPDKMISVKVLADVKEPNTEIKQDDTSAEEVAEEKKQ